MQSKPEWDGRQWKQRQSNRKNRANLSKHLTKVVRNNVSKKKHQQKLYLKEILETREKELRTKLLKTFKGFLN